MRYILLSLINQHVVGKYNLRSLTTAMLELGSKYEISTF